MAIIAYLDGIDVIKGSRSGITFDVSQASWIAKRRPTPTNPTTTPRNKVRSLLYATNAYYWAMTAGQRTSWANHAAANGITGPYGMTGHQAGCAMFFKLQVNAQLAGDPLYTTHPPHIPNAPPTNITLTWIDSTTIRTTFTASAFWNLKRIYLRQGLPGPGNRRWEPFDGYVAEYSGTNPNSPFDFTPKFEHIAGWNGRYWVGCQMTCGCRTAETLFDI